MHSYIRLAGRFLLTSSIAVAAFACEPAPEETKIPFYATPTPIPTPFPTPTRAPVGATPTATPSGS